MNKVYVLPPGEKWIVDQMVNDWNQYNKDITASNTEANVIWLLADWCWRNIEHLLLNKKVITTIHHIVPEKFGKNDMLFYSF